MKRTIAITLILLAANICAKASGDSSLDGLTRPDLSAAAISELVKSDTRMPTPSTYTLTAEQTNFRSGLTDNTNDQVCKAANSKINRSANLIPQFGISGGLRREFKSYPDRRLVLIDEIDLK